MNLQIRHVVLILLAGSLLFNVYLVTQLQTHLDLDGVEDNNSISSEHHHQNGPPRKRRSNTDRTVQKDGIEKRKADARWNARANTDPSILLSCEAFGGPTPREAAEMVYWRNDIPKEKRFQSAYFHNNDKADNDSSSEPHRYLVFMPDEAGFSNVRLSFETVVALAKATGRTLVLPPKQRFSQLLDGSPAVRSYWYADFLDISEIPTISFQAYLEREAMTGHLRDNGGTGSSVTFPPDNRTDWNGRIGNSNNAGAGDAVKLWKWVSSAMMNIDWKRDQCVVGFTGNANLSHAAIQNDFVAIINEELAQKLGPATRTEKYTGRPIPVDSSPRERLREMMAERRKLCIYNETMQSQTSIFMTGLEATGSRPLVPFYAYFYFDQWEQDLQMKRFIRDHLRFADHVQCAAARVVAAIRAKSRENGDPSGAFDSMHVRRTDFATLPVYNNGVVGAEKLVADNYFNDGRTVYISTDEKNKTFFQPMFNHYKILFLDDFKHLLQGTDPNFFGMIEQLIAARGDKFVGTYYSTFTAYINRIRGYHAQKNKLPSYLQGAINSEYTGHNGAYREVLHKFVAVHKDAWTREWPTAWRDIDHDVP